MRLSGFLMLLAVLGIPIWYVHRTVTEKHITKLDWNIFLTEEGRRQAEAEKLQKEEENRQKTEREKAEVERQRVEELQRQKTIAERAARVQIDEARLKRVCLESAEAAEASYLAYLQERKRYQSFISNLLDGHVPLAADGYITPTKFTEIFKRLRKEVWSDELVSSHLAKLQTATRLCGDLSQSRESDFSTATNTANVERIFFQGGTQKLSFSRSELLLVFRYSDQSESNADTLRQRIEREHVFLIYYDATH